MGTTTLLDDQVHLAAMKAIVRRFVEEIFEAGNPDAIDELVAPEFVSRTFGITENGPVALEAAMGRIHASLTDVEFRIDELVAEHDLIAVSLTSGATPTGEFMGVADARGKRYSSSEMHFFRIAEGRVVEHWHTHDALGILRQLGAAP